MIDYRQLKTAISGEDTPVDIFNEQEHPLPQVEQFLTAGWPVRKDRLARAILATSLRAGGLDLADGSTVTRENILKREYHHLFPNARLKEKGLSDREIFCSLNNALVTWKTNRTISDKEPELYLSERRDGTGLGEDEIRYRLKTHLIPYEEMTAGDYGSFLSKRAEMVYEAMISLCKGQAAIQV